MRLYFRFDVYFYKLSKIEVYFLCVRNKMLLFEWFLNEIKMHLMCLFFTSSMLAFGAR